MALTFTYLTRRTSLGFFSTPIGWIDAGFATLAVILAAGSRDNFAKYNQRLEMVLGTAKDTPAQPEARKTAKAKESVISDTVEE